MTGVAAGVVWLADPVGWLGEAAGVEGLRGVAAGVVWLANPVAVTGWLEEPGAAAVRVGVPAET